MSNLNKQSNTQRPGQQKPNSSSDKSTEIKHGEFDLNDSSQVNRFSPPLKPKPGRGK